MSAFYKLGWCFSGMTTSQPSGILHKGSRILIHYKSAGRRRKLAIRGKHAVTAGCAPNTSLVKLSLQEKHTIPEWLRNKSTKKAQSLAQNITIHDSKNQGNGN